MLTTGRDANGKERYEVGSKREMMNISCDLQEPLPKWELQFCLLLVLFFFQERHHQNPVGAVSKLGEFTAQ